MREAYATETNVLYRLPDQAITAREVGLTTGCNMAFLTVVMAICPPQTSSILVPLPAYFNYSMTLSLQSVKPVYLPSDPSNGFVPDLAAARSYLESDAARGQVRPRFILLTSPSNPTGTICPDAHLKRWYDLAREFSIALVIDETYREFVEPEDGGSGLGVPHRLFREPDWRDTVISLSSFSSASLFLPIRLRPAVLITRGVQDTRPSIGEYHCITGFAPTHHDYLRLHAGGS